MKRQSKVIRHGAVCNLGRFTLENDVRGRVGGVCSTDEEGGHEGKGSGVVC